MRALVAAILVTVCLTASARAARESYQPSRTALRRTRLAGEILGFGGGALVTAALSLSRKWSRPTGETVRFDDGRPFALEARHTPVVGPRLLAQARAIRGTSALDRFTRAFLAGAARGATNAPPSVARLEAWANDGRINHHTRGLR